MLLKGQEKNQRNTDYFALPAHLPEVREIWRKNDPKRDLKDVDAHFSACNNTCGEELNVSGRTHVWQEEGPRFLPWHLQLTDS